MGYPSSYVYIAYIFLVALVAWYCVNSDFIFILLLIHIYNIDLSILHPDFIYGISFAILYFIISFSLLYIYIYIYIRCGISNILYIFSLHTHTHTNTHTHTHTHIYIYIYIFIYIHIYIYIYI